jgi:hypothetical protein
VDTFLRGCFRGPCGTREREKDLFWHASKTKCKNPDQTIGYLLLRPRKCTFTMCSCVVDIVATLYALLHLNVTTVVRCLQWGGWRITECDDERMQTNSFHLSSFFLLPSVYLLEHRNVNPFESLVMYIAPLFAVWKSLNTCSHMRNHCWEYYVSQIPVSKDSFYIIAKLTDINRESSGTEHGCPFHFSLGYHEINFLYHHNSPLEQLTVSQLVK